jgi:hypothetical protein
VEALKAWLLEKQRRGILQVRVNSVLEKITEFEAGEKEKRANGTRRRRKLPLVGTAEAAEILGVERPRIGRWKKSGVLPEPVAEVAAGPIWYRSQIEGVREERERRRRVPAK